MAELIPDIHEKIIRTWSVRDLIRCKSVCKPWKSLFASSHFIKDHLKSSIKEFEHQRSGTAVFPVVSSEYHTNLRYYIVGSVNGLVCISNIDGEIIVANPSTREMRMMQRPSKIIKFSSLLNCWGFGYDSSADDYKVVLGFITKREGVAQTCVKLHVLSLKLNVWIVIEKVNYISNSGTIYMKNFLRKVGVLCNGALHWVINDQSDKQVIFSFNLSTEEFIEIPQPNYDVIYGNVLNDKILNLGIMNECLCIYHRRYLWIMKKYNEKHSWEKLEDDWDVEGEFVDRLKEVAENDIIPYENMMYNEGEWFFGNRRFIYAPKVVQSLVSPYFDQ